MATNTNPDPAADLQAQHEAALARIRDLEATATRGAELLANEARTRIAAEVETFRAPLLAKDDLRFNAQTVGAFVNLLIVAKSAAAGLAAATINAVGEDGTTVVAKEIALDAKSLGAFVASELARATKAGAKFDPPTNLLRQDTQLAQVKVTRADFEAADAGDVAAGAKVDAAIREVIAGDMSKYSSTFSDLRQKALAAAA